MYDGWRQPLSLYYRSWLSNPRKSRLAPSKTTMQRLFWPGAAFASIDRVYTAASNKLYLCGGIIQILLAEYLHKCILFLPG